MNNVTKIIITGGPEGQLTLIKQLRRQDHNVSLTWLNPLPEAFLSDVSVSYLYKNRSEDLDREIEQTRALVKEKYHVDILEDQKVLSIDFDPLSLLLSCKGRVERLPFDRLLSSGCPRPIASDPEKTLFCHSLSDITAIKNSTPKKPSSVLILGGSERAIELALLLHHDNKTVTIIEPSKRFLPMYSIFTANDIRQEIETAGIKIILGGSTEKLSQLSADLVISTECRYAHSILEKAQIILSPSGNVEVDDSSATSLPSVFAFGQGIVMPSLSFAEYAWPKGAMAIYKSALVTANNALQINKERLSPLAEVRMHRVGILHYARAGLDETTAKNKFMENVAVLTHFHDKNQGFTRLIFNKETGHVLGAEIKSTTDPSNAINFIAFAVQTSLTLEHLKKIDCISDENLFCLMDALDKAKKTAGAFVTTGDVASFIMQNKDFLLIDVGEQEQEAPIKQGGIHFSLAEIKDNLSFIKAQSMPIFLACEDGEKSVRAYQYLVNQGIQQIFVLDGGRKSLEVLLSSL